MLKVQFSQRWVEQLESSKDWLLLGLWVVIGGILRFTQLTAKPPWTDEFATMVFSLGNNFTSVPLNQIIPIDVLLQPLRFNPDAGIGDVVSLILREDNHPPLYFVLTHLWVKLFPPLGEYADVWMMRSLPALLGVLSILAMYFFGKIAFQSRLVGHLSAALMAVSPYGIFLAQEARHYTLVILFVIASLICLVIATRHLFDQAILPWWLVFSWIVTNSLGISVHYFFALTLLGEAITLIILIYHHFTQQKNRLFLKRNLIRIALVILGTITVGLIWIFVVIPLGYGNNMITWIHPLTHILFVISPPFQLLAVWIPMISLLPVESSSIPIVAISGIILLLFFIWFVPYIIKRVKQGLRVSQFRLPIIITMTFIASVIALFLVITYIIGLDLTRAARYSFTYFPAVLVLVGVSLAITWHEVKPVNLTFHKKQTLNPLFLLQKIYKKLNSHGRLATSVILLMGLLGSITVLANLGYQKYYRPDQLITVIKDTASAPVVIATTQKSLVQTGEMMGIALELERHSDLENISFLLTHQDQDNSPEATANLKESIEKTPHPVEVWAVNFIAPIELNHCTLDSKKYPYIHGYGYQRYTCPSL